MGRVYQTNLNTGSGTTGVRIHQSPGPTITHIYKPDFPDKWLGLVQGGIHLELPNGTKYAQRVEIRLILVTVTLRLFRAECIFYT